MSYKDWYSIRKEGDRFAIYKFDQDHNPQGVPYYVSLAADKLSMCDCFAGHTWCRHKKMIVEFQKLDRVNSGWLYNFDRNKWIKPIQQEE